MTASGLRVGGPYTVSVSSDALGDMTVSDIFTRLGDTFSSPLSLGASTMEEVVVTSAMVRTQNLALGPSSSIGLEDLQDFPAINRDIRDIIRHDPRIYQDQGFEAARGFVLRVMAPELDRFILQGTAPDNPKSRLQEYIQGMGRAAPRYQLASSEGPDHDPWFNVDVLVESEVIGRGQGGKKADAERAAAADALGKIESQTPEAR